MAEAAEDVLAQRTAAGEGGVGGSPLPQPPQPQGLPVMQGYPLNCCTIFFFFLWLQKRCFNPSEKRQRSFRIPERFGLGLAGARDAHMSLENAQYQDAGYKQNMRPFLLALNESDFFQSIHKVVPAVLQLLYTRRYLRAKELHIGLRHFDDASVASFSPSTSQALRCRGTRGL